MSQLLIIIVINQPHDQKSYTDCAFKKTQLTFFCFFQLPPLSKSPGSAPEDGGGPMANSSDDDFTDLHTEEEDYSPQPDPP